MGVEEVRRMAAAYAARIGLSKHDDDGRLKPNTT
jgi:hypothetical protein